jgi:hypothetical protein
MIAMIIVFALLAGGFVELLAGLSIFKVRVRWCRTCGTTLSCSTCAAAVLPPGGDRDRPDVGASPARGGAPLQCAGVHRRPALVAAVEDTLRDATRKRKIAR